MESSKENICLASIIQKAAEDHQRSSSESEMYLKVLNDNWVDSLAHWTAMASPERHALGLPVVVEQVIEEVVTSTTPFTNKMTTFITSERVPDFTDFCFLFENYSARTIQLSVDGRVYCISSDAPLSSLLKLLFQDFDRCEFNGVYAIIDRKEGQTHKNPRPISPVETNRKLSNVLFKMIDSETIPAHDTGKLHCKINEETEISLALMPGRKLYLSSKVFLIQKYCSFAAVCAWLQEMNLSHQCRTFYVHMIDDFMLLPFLRKADLEKMGVIDAEALLILQAVKRLQDGSNLDLPALWLKYLGFEQYSETFRKHGVSTRFLGQINLSHLKGMGIHQQDLPKIFEILSQHAEFTSVEATYQWLKATGFDEYALQFLRYNIPFYALPLVNFFILNEMGIVAPDYALLKALRDLKDQPVFSVKAISYWLRDLELDRYSLNFAKYLMVNFIEVITILTDQTISRLIDDVPSQEKMRLAVHDMKEFQLYYSDTASRLQELILDKYAHVFTKAPIDLPSITDGQLEALGVDNEVDRKQILHCISKMKQDMPPVFVNPQHVENSHRQQPFKGYNHDPSRQKSDDPDLLISAFDVNTSYKTGLLGKYKGTAKKLS